MNFLLIVFFLHLLLLNNIQYISMGGHYIKYHEILFNLVQILNAQHRYFHSLNIYEDLGHQ